jgi:hypothetical protein
VNDDKFFARFFGAFAAAWVAAALVSLAAFGVAIWAVIALVNWLVTQ